MALYEALYGLIFMDIFGMRGFSWGLRQGEWGTRGNRSIIKTQGKTSENNNGKTTKTNPKDQSTHLYL